MVSRPKTLIAAAASAVLAVGLAGCGGGGGGGDANNDVTRTEATKGGTLEYYYAGVIDHLDPQRMYVGVDIANMNRMVYRGLVSFPAGIEDVDEGTTPVADLATDTGTANDDATQWQFTIKDGVTWQDGEPITCEDFKYGASRTFSVDVITGGPNYMINYLDVDPDYKGPLEKSPAAAVDSFDKAITCDGNTITYNFKKPWPDFPLAIASLPSNGPFREDQEQGDKSNYDIFSNGPYMLDGTWDADKGGTFVRNPNYDASTDDPAIREANPDEVDFQIGFDPETNVAVKKIIEDQGDDANAITISNVTPDLFPKLTGDVADRAINLPSPYTTYLLPNFNQVTDPDVRKALAMATNRAAYIQALGGDKVADVASSIVNPEVPGYEENPAFADIPDEGDLDAAKQMLEDAGVKTPYPIKLTYPLGSDARNKAFAALKDSYDQAGFEVTLDGLDPTTNYYPTVQNPGSDSDLIYGGWGADWPSISTVIPPLFDSRINLTSKTSNGQDYGNYESDDVNSMIDDAGAELDQDAANSMYADIDAALGDDTAYIPLTVILNYFVRGSNIENYVPAAGTSGYPDLGVISLAGGGS